MEPSLKGGPQHGERFQEATKMDSGLLPNAYLCSSKGAVLVQLRKDPFIFRIRFWFRIIP